MLAYVFWHWPKPDVDPAQYERDQRAFHHALAAAAPGGFRNSLVFRVGGEAPWLGGAPAYADWYLLETSTALDELNAAAVSGICEQPHRALTVAMSAGAGSLLTLRTGDPVLASSRAVTLLTKPRDLPYAEFDRLTAPVPGIDQAALWRRALVLGPTPEFLALSRIELTFPAILQPHRLALTPI
jgi:hypothetical protein